MLNPTTVLALFVLPLAFALILPVMTERGSVLPRIVTMVGMLGVLALSVTIFVGYDGSTDPQLLAVNVPWIASLGVNFHLGVDGMNIYLMLLTSLLFPVVLACTWKTAHADKKLYLGLLLIMETSLLGTFLSQNLMLFFVFWEAVLIPMFILILTFGGENRRKAAMTFFMYTMVGSILLLAAVILLGVESLHQTGSWNFEFSTLYHLHLSTTVQMFVFVAVVLACLIKCPVFPFHSWLPLAYYEAPAAGTALMAGAMSKMGAFGLLKLAIPLCPQVSVAFAPTIILLAVISILYGAVLALRQQDFKKLIAYSSLSHMGYIVLGIFCLQQSSIHGSLFQILSHGVAVAGLFLMLDLLEQRLGASYKQLNALSIYAPRLAVTLMLFILASVALPLTSGFTSEFLILFGGFQHGLQLFNTGNGLLVLVCVILACSGMVLGAGYMLRFARAILYGKANEEIGMKDMNLRETIAFVPLLAIVVIIGIWPYPVMIKAQNAVEQLTALAAGTQQVQALPQTTTTLPIGGADGH